MASSVAPMPISGKWLEPVRASDSAAHSRCSFNSSYLGKIVAPQRETTDVHSSSSSSSDRSEEDGGSPGILERWASLQVRELARTLDRQAREAEILALATAAPPVSARALSFLREASDSSSPGTAAVAAVDLPRSVRASSLIQMWRDLETDAGFSPKNRPENSSYNADNATPAATSSSSDELSSDYSGDSDSDIAATNCSLLREKNGRVENIVRMMSSGNRTRTAASSLNSKNKQSPRKKPEAMADKTSSDLRSIEDFVARMEQERRSELVALNEHRCVSQFQHQPIYGLTKHSTPKESDELHRRTAIMHPRRKQLDAEDFTSQFTAKRYDSESYRHTNSSWDERNLWMSNLDLQSMADLLPSYGWGSEVITEEGESYLQQHVSRWMHQPSSSWRQLAVRRQPMCVGFFQKFADNVEIMELYERRRVSTSLDSDFCNKLNTMVLSLLDRQRTCCFDEDLTVNDEDHPFWQQKDGYFNSSKHVVDIPSSCLTPQNHTMCHSEHQKHASSPHQSSKNDVEFMDELRSGMTQIHEELHELRKLVKSCMEKQVELRDSIKQDILDVIRQSSESLFYSLWNQF
ncbi:hypothetical protein ZIOFF_009250 [Zingiber officinale]|uniref:Uncharacterized protein n=1 Tax=Zingiber officinale TaxID=94328 RepID=A0A8J5HH30_ZINOF|nr:hypothetical protein ZIOFF_009250 [Zingiber officinale]